MQQSLRIIISKRNIEQKKNLRILLSLNLQIFSTKVKNNNIKKVKKMLDQLIEEAKEKYAYRQYNKLWNKVNPYFLKLLAIKKNRKYRIEAQKIIMKNKYITCINVMQLNLLFSKIKKKKKSIGYIYNYASTRIFSSYYIDMIKNISIIQKYMNIHIYKTKVFDKINNKYFRDDNYNETLSKEDEEEFENNNNNNNPINENNIKNKNDINNYRYYNTIENDKIKSNKIGTLNDTRFTTIGLNNDSKTNQFLSNNLATLNTIENEKQSTVRYKKKKKYINNFNITDNINEDVIKNKRYKDLKSINYNDYNKNANNLLPIKYNFSQPIIGIFAKILDIDYIYNYEEESNDQSWDEEFLKIYKECLKNETPIQKIEISNCHTMVLNSIGKIYSWGWNNFGQCGVFPNLTKESYIFPNIMRKNNEKFPILPVLNYKYCEKCLPIQNISNMVLKDDFSIILTQKGNAILFGDNQYGQLGQGHRMDVKSAQILSKFKNKIKSIYSSGNMNLFLTKKNDLYIWYISENLNLIKPTLINIDKKIKIESISTGNNFSILLSSNGICFGLGSNEIGELGMENVKFCNTPQEISNLTLFNERIRQIRCGFKHTICVSVNGKVYSWGNNTFGQLGHINNGNNLPSNIEFEEKGERTKIIQVSAGFRSSFFLTNKGDIYYSGVLNNNEKTMVPKIFDLFKKNENVCDEREFLPVKIRTTYSRNKTIFYASFADVRSLNNRFYNIEKLKNIALTLAEKWINDDITAPFIPHISKYFQSNFMIIEGKK